MWQIGASRRNRGVLGVLVALGFLLSGCGPSAPAGSNSASPPKAAPAGSSAPAASASAASAPASSSAPAATGDPIRIGVPLSLTGTFAATGKQQLAAINVALRDMGNQVANRPVEIVQIDDEGTPEAALRVTRRLVERDNVDVIIGYSSSAVGYATRDFLHEVKKPTISVAAAAGLTRENKSPYIWRIMFSNFQFGYEPAKYLRDKVGAKRIIFWGADYAAPREGYRAVKEVYGDGIVREIWTPLNTMDYAPYVASIRPGEADFVTIAAWGADGARITEQYHRAGLTMPVYGWGSFTSEDVLPGFSPEAVNGVQSSNIYCSSLDTPANREFVAKFKEQHGDLPGAHAYLSYLGTRLIGKAIEMVNGDVSNPDRLVEALGKARLDDMPTGSQSFDANQALVADFFWLKVELENGKPVNRCVDRIPQVKDPVQEFPVAAP